MGNEPIFPCENLLSVPKDLNSILEDSELFSIKKHDRATTVGIIKGSVFNYPDVLLVKRFNSRGSIDFLLKKLVGSRARRLYKINLRLYEKGLPVPKPLWYVEPSWKEKSAFFISTVVENACHLGELFRKGLVPGNRKLVEQLAVTLSSWHLSGAVHGDLKWPNILVRWDDSDCSVFLVDLDQAKLYSKISISGIVKDLKRFYRFGIGVGAEQWVRSEVFSAYIVHMPDEIIKRIDLDFIRDKALKEWREKGCKHH